MSRQSCIRAIAIISLLTLPVLAATFVVPDDETFIRKADVIVTGTVLDSHVQYEEQGDIETVYRIAVDEVLKGQADSIIEIREWGGVVGDRFMVMSGAPQYEIGKRYLIFMTPFRDGRLTTLDLALGQFRFINHQGQQVLERDRDEILDLSGRGLPMVRPPKNFIETIRQQVKRDGAFSAQSNVAISPQANDLDTASAAAAGASAWSGGTTVNYSVSGTPATGDTKNLTDGQERIIIDDPHGDIGGTFGGSGVVATAFFGGNILADRVNIDESDIVVQDGVSSSTLSQSNYNSTMTHEMGHTLGFRHSNQNKFSESGTSCSAPLPCSSSAIMNSSVINGLNGNLQSWDSAAVNSSYGSSPDPDYQIINAGQNKPWYRSSPSASWRITAQEEPCSGPTITQQPSATPSSITSGQSSTLSVTATAGTGSLSYKWYRTPVGQTSNQVGTGSSIQVSPTTSNSYWVRVTDGCSSVDSNAVMVTVQQGCGGPGLATPVANPSVINSGGSSTLSIAASASEGPLSYQWYIGSSGQTGNPIGGATGSSTVVSPATTTSYWVRVTDQCNGGTSKNSSTVTVTICVPPTITEQPPDRSVESGNSVTLSTAASGTSPTIRWYRGTVGNTSNLIATSSSVNVSPTTNTQYWARASNSCGQDDTRQVTVTVVGGCVAPQITQQPQQKTIDAGQTATLTVSATGTSLAYQWYEVQGGGTTFVPISGANSSSYTTPPLSSTKAYLVQVTNGCGLANSNQVQVVVGQCVAPQITQQPQQKTIQPGQTATLTVVVTGTGLSYQWYEVQGGGTTFVPIPGANAASYKTPALSSTKAYLVQVTNNCGLVNSNQVLVIVSQCTGPTITTQPRSVSAAGGSRVVLSVTATGTAPLTYKWFEGKSGLPSIPIAGANASTLVIPAAKESSYWVKVSNDCGEINSATAFVSVEVSRRRSVRRP